MSLFFERILSPLASQLASQLAIVSLFLFPSIALADDTTATNSRPSDINLSITSGRDSFISSGLSARVGLDDTWLFKSNLGRDKSEGITQATRFSAGADARLSDSVSINFGLVFLREPDEVNGRGLDLGGNWTISDLWSADLQTNFSLQSRLLKYTQSSGRVARARGDGIAQNSLTLGLSQEITTDISISADFTGYGFGGASAQDLSTAISSRPNLGYGLMTVVDGTPERAYSFGTSWLVTDAIDLGVSLFKTDFFSGSSSKGLEFSGDFRLSENWSVGLNASGTKTDGGPNSGLLGFNVGYRW